MRLKAERKTQFRKILWGKNLDNGTRWMGACKASGLLSPPIYHREKGP